MSTSTGQKRKANNFSPTTPIYPSPLNQDIITLHTIRRHQHRRRNIAAGVWGITAPPTLGIPSTPFPSTVPKTPFNIYKSLLRHPNLFFQFTLRLPYETIILLYAIDKEFHYRLNKYSVSLIHDYARYHAPLASHIFSWVMFPELCISDPMLRPMDGREWLARDVPGFRWIGMVLHRQRVVRGILTNLAVEGLRVPMETEGMLEKFWCVMECKTTSLRNAFLQDKNIWTDRDILLFQLLLMKLDMRFSDAVLSNGIGELSHMLLTQKGLEMLYRVLTRQVRLDYDKATDILVRTYLSEDLDTDAHPWLDDELDNGVPEEEWGLLCREGWHVDGKRMDSAVDMVILEGIRRGLGMQKYYLEFVMYGFVDDKGRNASVPKVWRKGSEVNATKQGWPSEEIRQKALERLTDAYIHAGDTMVVDS
jgi:hypothetical protein